MWSQGEYGPHHAIYRLLRILKEENVKATFLTCGAIAERYPEAVQAILDHGHVVEGHGYNHEIARYLPRDEEDKVMKKTIAMIEKRTGRRCYGWRSCTQSTNSIELMIENGFVFNTNCFHEEMPFLWEKNGKLLVELPRQPFGDGTLFGTTAMANTAIRIMDLRPGRPISTSSIRKAHRSGRSTFPLRCTRTSSAVRDERWRFAASSTT
jgi:peptidoglycan/xylan/chitin deacetylase (PgdA/CDA1 family)